MKRQMYEPGMKCLNRDETIMHQGVPPYLSTHLGGDGELGDDDCHGVGVLGQLPGAGQLHHLLIGVGGVGQQGFGVSQTLKQGLNLIEIGLLPEKLRLLEVARQRQLRRTQEVQDVAETAERRADQPRPPGGSESLACQSESRWGRKEGRKEGRKKGSCCTTLMLNFTSLFSLLFFIIKSDRVSLYFHAINKCH